MTRLEGKLQEERTLEENTLEEAPTFHDHKHFETSEVDERVNVKAAETENVETNEAGNVILCCFAALLLHVYYFDL